LFTFLGVAPGMRVAELAAGGGYSAEILARVVGPDGKVYGQNSKFILERFAEAPWSKRLLKPVMGNVVRLDSEFGAPFTSEVKDLDLVVMILFYHDTVWMKTDRDAMNRAVFAALKSGGVYGIVDHSAREGAGVDDAESLHRIEESVVKADAEKAGFLLQESADFLRNPDDARDWNASPSQAGEQRGTSDRFVLKFMKP
jgi:predicted methyltransferase